MIELAAGTLLAGVLAMAGAASFGEADVRAKLTRAHAGLQAVAAAMESYRLENDGYPATLASSQIEPREIFSSMDSRLLSTPVSYLAAVPFDPFREVAIPLRMYATGITPFISSYERYPHNAYLAWSLGPDAHSELGGYRSLESVVANESLATPNLKYDGMRYDPTNGLTSIGDIYFFGPGSE